MTRRIWTVPALWIMAAALACASDRSSVGAASTGLGPAASASGGAPAGATTGDAEDADGGDATPRLDVAVPDESGVGEGGGGTRCEKIDFLFVVDNSSSMWTYQQRLKDSFPNFIAAIRTQVEVEDLHIMVVDSDELRNSAYCESTMCAGNPVPGTGCSTYECGTGQLDCDDHLGAGVVGDCGGLDAGRYMTDQQPDLEGTFGCVAEVGADGADNEQVVNSMITALAPERVGAGGCNEGFLRDDAILVATFLSDAGGPPPECVGQSTPQCEFATDSKEQLHEDPQDWIDAVFIAKPDAPEAITVVGLLGDAKTANPVCRNDRFESAPYREFVNGFGSQGTWGSICLEDYGPVFSDALGLIRSSCDTFVPPG